MHRVFLLCLCIFFTLFQGGLWAEPIKLQSLQTEKNVKKKKAPIILKSKKTEQIFKREIIKIAVILPLSGRSQASGKSLKKALPFIEYFNEEKRFNRAFHSKYDFKTILFDDACDASRAQRIAHHIVAQQDIHFVIGHYCSSTSLVGAKIYKGEGILQISPFSTASNLTEQDFEHFFRLAGRNDRQAEEAGMRMTQFAQGRKIGIISGATNYGQDLAKRVVNVLKRNSITPKMEIDLTKKRAYSEIARALVHNDIKVVYYGGYYQELVKILKAVDNIGGKIYFFSADSVQNRQFWEEAGLLASNVLFTLTLDYSRDVSDREKNQLKRIRRQEEQAKQRGQRASFQALSKDRAFNLRTRFMREYFKHYGYFPDLYALQLYAAYQIIKEIALDTRGSAGLVTATDYEDEDAGEGSIVLRRYDTSQQWVKQVSIYIREMGINAYSDYVGFETIVGAVNFDASGEWGNAKYHIYKWVNEREDRTWLANTREEAESDMFKGRMGDFTRIF